jgi:hypothetical protein
MRFKHWSPYFSSDLGWFAGTGSWAVAGALLVGGFPASGVAAMGPAGEVSVGTGGIAFSPCPIWPTGGLIENECSPGFWTFIVLVQLSRTEINYTLLA